MCDNFGCGWDVQSEGPPTNLPSWFKCPASVTEKAYPAPAGVEIMPITEGGRNGPSKKKKFACGSCAGSTTAGKKGKKEPAKPKISSDCPMSKATMGFGKCEAGPKPAGVFARIKEFFLNLTKK